MAGYFRSTRDIKLPLAIEFREKTDYPLIKWDNTAFPPLFENRLHQETYSFRSRSADQSPRTRTNVFGVDVTESHTGVNPLEDALKLNNFNTPFDNGHEFNTLKREIRIEKPVTISHSRGGQFHGPLIPSTLGQVEFNYAIPDVPIVYGTRLIKSAVPTRPAAQVATALGEILLGGLPALGSKTLQSIYHLQTRAQHFKSLPSGVGSDYLSSVFGWQPLVSDMISVASALKDASDVLKQYASDSGKPIRRSRSIPPTSKVSNLYDEDTPGFLPGLYGLNSQNPDNARWFFGGGDGGRSRQRVYRSIDQEIWFDGQFTYALTTGDGVIDRLSQYEELSSRLLGTRITPEVLWELTPWSWLADWFINIGDILSNVSRFQSDNLVMRYGYLMCHTTVRTTHVTTTNGLLIGHNRREYTATDSLERKQRVRATPYGFGLDPDGFTANQWAILAALGLTKADRKLWYI